jgi:hypothetical protein
MLPGRVYKNKVRQPQVCLGNILLISEQQVWALVISHNQAWTKIRKERTLAYSTLLLNQLRSELCNLYKSFY